MRLTYSLVLFILCQTWLYAQEKQEKAAPTFDRRSEMIAMRDGVKLNTLICTPKDQKDSLPIIIQRTPYGADGHSPLSNYTRDMANDGYIFVYQDIRGRFKSEGAFDMMRAPRDKSNPQAIDESSDTYDTIEWLIKNLPNNNGKVGILGISYDGWLATMALLDPHPALAAASPQAPVADMFLGDDFHHNGAFRLSYGFEYVTLMETNNRTSQFKFDKYDTYDWYLKLGPLSNAAKKHLSDKFPTWNNFVKHPNYDAFWQKQAASKYLTKCTVPTLNVGGWWDQEDFYGPLKTYASLEPHDKKSMNFMVVGPWNHGGWAGGNGDALDKIKFNSPTAKYYRETVQAGFFAKFLKGKNTFDVDEVLTFQTGSNQWVKASQWPPKESQTKKLYFREDGKLSFDAPTSAGGEDTYLSDPKKPVPYRQRPIQATYGPGSTWSVWLVQDQRFVHNRPDVLSWETDTLTEDLVMTGNVFAKLFASTTGTDSDWIVKLIDVYPDDGQSSQGMAGYQLMIANDVFRGRFRESFENPKALEPGKVNDFTIDLHAMNHCFKKGHKVMVQVQSTWFPLIDRNPQTFVPNIFEAKEADFQIATQKIVRTAQQPSHLEVPVFKP
ncbi:MAG TPA: CocE/NonD family hydrolase [Gemmatales bacterium]|nr:CocE/NonD family hydrolase [Gemmatales bacterium]